MFWKRCLAVAVIAITTGVAFAAGALHDNNPRRVDGMQPNESASVEARVDVGKMAVEARTEHVVATETAGAPNAEEPRPLERKLVIEGPTESLVAKESSPTEQASTTARMDLEKALIERGAKRFVSPSDPNPKAEALEYAPKARIERSTERLVSRSAAATDDIAKENESGRTPDSPANPTAEPGKVVWHDDLEAACAASRESGKPVLLFQMMGNLDDRFC